MKNTAILKLIAITVFAFTLTLLLSLDVSAASKIKSVKKKKVYISLTKRDAKIFKKGEVYSMYTKRGKKRGEIEIIRIKKRKAIGRVVKGKARKSYFVKARRSKSESMFSGKNKYLGGLAGFSNNVIENAGTLEGTSLSFKAFFDYPFMDSIWLRISAGMRGFKAEDKSNASNFAEIQYFSAGGTARYMFGKNKMRFWLGGFFSVLSPMSNSSTALNNVDDTSVYGGAFGLDYVLNKKMMIPFTVEYGLFPKSDQGTSTTSITLSTGFGYRF